MTKRVFTWSGTGGRAFVPGRATAQLLPPPRARPERPLGALRRLSARGREGGAGPGAAVADAGAVPEGFPEVVAAPGRALVPSSVVWGQKGQRRAWTPPTPPPSHRQVRREEAQGHPADPGRLGDGSTPAASTQPGRGPCGDPAGWRGPRGPQRGLGAPFVPSRMGAAAGIPDAHAGQRGHRSLSPARRLGPGAGVAPGSCGPALGGQ